MIDPASIPKLEVIESNLKISAPDRFADLTDGLSTRQRADLVRPGRSNRIDLSDDRMTVHLRYPAAERPLDRYLPGPTVPWQSSWRGRGRQPFDFPWNPRFCMSDGACFQLAAGALRTTRRYVLDRETGVVHRLHLARMPLWFGSFGTEVRRTACPFD